MDKSNILCLQDSDNAFSEAVWADYYLAQDKISEEDTAYVIKGYAGSLQTKGVFICPEKSEDVASVPVTGSTYLILHESPPYLSWGEHTRCIENKPEEYFANREWEYEMTYGDVNHIEFSVEQILIPKARLKWVDFCESLFPKHREHTPEERKAYSNFINSYFEEIEI